MSTPRKKNNRCAACFREVVAKGKKYCIYHSQAYDSLQKQYDAWVHAYGGISKVDYMNKLLTLSQTGSWVKEVIKEELKIEKISSWELERLGTALSTGDNPLPLGVALKISQVAVEGR